MTGAGPPMPDERPCPPRHLPTGRKRAATPIRQSSGPAQRRIPAFAAVTARKIGCTVAGCTAHCAPSSGSPPSITARPANFSGPAGSLSSKPPYPFPESDRTTRAGWTSCGPGDRPLEVPTHSTGRGRHRITPCPVSCRTRFSRATCHASGLPVRSCLRSVHSFSMSSAVISY